MNPHLIAGCAFLVLNTLLPWAVLIALWRRYGGRGWFFAAACVLAPAISFAFGGAWYTVVAPLLLEGPGAIPAQHFWHWFVLAGGCAVAYLAPGSLAVLAAGAAWQRLAPASYGRLLRRRAEAP